MQETWVRSLGWEDPLEKGKATYSSILGWRIPWTIVNGVSKSQTWLSSFHIHPTHCVSNKAYCVPLVTHYHSINLVSAYSVPWVLIAVLVTGFLPVIYCLRLWFEVFTIFFSTWKKIKSVKLPHIQHNMGIQSSVSRKLPMYTGYLLCSAPECCSLIHDSCIYSCIHVYRDQFCYLLPIQSYLHLLSAWLKFLTLLPSLTFLWPCHLTQKCCVSFLISRYHYMFSCSHCIK